MVKFAVVKTGGKQYLVKDQDEIVVDNLGVEKDKEIELQTLCLFNNDGTSLQLGQPLVKQSVKARVIENLKGDKIRVARFKAKVRYRKVKGFRARLTRLKIVKI